MKKTIFFTVAAFAIIATFLVGCEGQNSLSTPSNFKAYQEGNTIVLSWNEVSGASYYEINKNGSYWQSTSETSIVDKSPREGINSYELIASNGDKQSKPAKASCEFESSGSGGGGSEQGSLPAPTGFKLSQTSEYVQLSWNKVSGAVGYYALWYDSQEEKWYVLEETTSTSYKDYNVTAGSTYIYGVTALDASGNNGEIAYDQITFNGSSSGGGGGGSTSKPNTPTGVKATAGSSSISVTWNSVSGATSYNIYRSTSASGSYSYQTSVYSTSYTDYNVNAGTTYYYKVSAENSAGESSMSSYASAKIASSGGGDNPGGGTTNYEPCPPSVTCSGSSSVTIKWTASTGYGCGKPTSYDVKRMNRITGQAETLKSGTTSTSYTDSQPFPGINTYGVTAINSYGSGSGTAISSAIGIAAPTLIGTKISASANYVFVAIKDLDVPEEWKQYYTLELYKASSYSGNYYIEHSWKYNEFSSGIDDKMNYDKYYGSSVNLSGKTYYYKVRWVFQAPYSPSRVEGAFTSVQTVKH